MNNKTEVIRHNEEKLYVRYKRLHLSKKYTFKEYIEKIGNEVMYTLEQFNNEERSKISELELHEDKDIKESVVALLLGHSEENNEETSFVVFIDEIHDISIIYKVKFFLVISKCNFEQFITESSKFITEEGLSPHEYELSYFFAEQEGIVFIID